ncbi:MAG: YkgJ family cysteine cluster protein [Desulfobacteraceae bacterium]|nr:YkgJ family cysteine cluster protein [Desulfobacteraceae bacterium]MBC2754063.1 YkgJ family cysteine cluster protein [Desulfobacteraceae bacterium]
MIFDKYINFFNDLKFLYARMDEMYDAVADAYGFHCSGCSDNCCLTRFFHHTLIEFLYLRKGFADLDESIREEVRYRALNVNEKVLCAEDGGHVSRIMCPLNREGLCILYEYRPMICRLHGIPHEFQHPARNKILGPGCHEFDAQCGQKQYLTFNRTPFYQQMALLERRLREMTGMTDKFKKTVAQMLVKDLEKIL